VKNDSSANEPDRHTPVETDNDGSPDRFMALASEAASTGDEQSHAIFRTNFKAATAAPDAPGLFPFFDAGPAEQIGIWIRPEAEGAPFVLVKKLAADLLPQDGSQFFPVYLFDQNGSIRIENITDWALDRFREHYKEPVISKWSIFDYIYGMLHHPGYRQTFRDNLKRELPRIPFAPDFRAFQRTGQKLIELHLHYKTLDPWALELVKTPGVPISYRVKDKMRLSKDKTRLTINPSLSLAGIPPEAFEYRLGDRPALQWVIDAYPLKTDPRSGITADVNRPEGEQSIVRLLGQVIRVSIETVNIIKGLPPRFTAESGAFRGTT
jgi:predicted helicase